MLRVPSSIVAPAAITVRFRSPTFGPDLTDITGVDLNVLRRDGSTGTWACTIVAATAAELIAQYEFTDTGEITTTGIYYLSPALAVSGGSVPAQTIAMFVEDSGSPVLDDESWLVATVAISQGWSTANHGVTASRPTAIPGIGFQYFDTTLGYPVFWTGVEWVDASGDAV